MYIILVFGFNEILLKAYGDMLANKHFLKKKKSHSYVTLVKIYT